MWLGWLMSVHISRNLPFWSNTWMRLFPRSATYTRPFLSMAIECGRLNSPGSFLAVLAPSHQELAVLVWYLHDAAVVVPVAQQKRPVGQPRDVRRAAEYAPGSVPISCFTPRSSAASSRRSRTSKICCVLSSTIQTLCSGSYGLIAAECGPNCLPGFSGPGRCRRTANPTGSTPRAPYRSRRRRRWRCAFARSSAR